MLLPAHCAALDWLVVNLYLPHVPHIPAEVSVLILQAPCLQQLHMGLWWFQSLTLQVLLCA